MRYFLLVLVFLLIKSSWCQDFEENELHTLVLSHHSGLIIYGETNVSSFSCDYQLLNNKDSIQFIYTESGNETDFIDAHINLRVNQFDCGSNLITNDFTELLQESKHPHVTIKFIDFIEIDGGWSEDYEQNVLGHFDLEIEVAGINKRVIVPVFQESIASQEIFFLGDVKLDIREYGLEAPEKFMGMVKVENEIMIEMKLAFIRVM
jgi:hypothetical protein